MKNQIATTKKFIADHKVAIAVTAGVTAGVAATLAVIKTTNVDLLASENNVKRLAEEGGQLVFDTARGTMRVRVTK